MKQPGVRAGKSERNSIPVLHTFTDKADKYVSSRPSYPTKLMDYLYNEVGFSDKSKIADIGAGTGIFTRQLLERNSDVRCLHHILLRRMMKSLMNM